VNSFIFYGKSGEIATNRLDDQEIAVLSLHLLQLDFGQSSGQQDAMDEEIQRLSRKLHELCLRSRVHPIPGTPQMLTHQGQTVRERWFPLVVPGRHWYRNATLVTQPQGQHGDEGKQGQQNRGCPGDGLVRPLPLGLQAEMGAALFKGHFPYVST
jgi:hypothetical protein